MKLKNKCFLLITGILFSCSKTEIINQVQKPPRLNINNVTSISIGEFKDIKNQDISLPLQKKNSRTVNLFQSNASSANLVRALTVNGLSDSQQYQLLNTNGNRIYNGVIPNQEKTAILSADVKFFYLYLLNKEPKLFRLYSSTNEVFIKNKEEQDLIINFVQKTVAPLVARNQLKIKEYVPTIEIIAAMEVTFHLSRKSTQKKIIPSRTFRSYYTRKWGGNNNTSKLTKNVRTKIQKDFQKDEEEFEKRYSTLFKQTISNISNPNQFLAKGGNLEENLNIPKTVLDIQYRLAKDVSKKYLQLITKYTETTKLEVQNGDETGTILLQANAFSHAINHLEALNNKSAVDYYHLGLAYESIGERNQSLRFYQQALQKDQDNELYKKAFNRVKP